MFQSCNMIHFGNELRYIRKSMKLTQRDVYETIGINEDTLRKIENGKVIPKYETIELLSSMYKRDLLNVLMENRTSKSWYQIINQIDYWIINNQFEKLKLQYESLPYSEIFKLKEDLIDSKQLEQFELFLEGSLKLFEQKCNVEEIQEIFMRSMQVTNPTFSIETLGTTPSSYLELRVLLGLGIVYAELDELEISNKLLEFVYTEISRNTIDSADTKKLLVKTIYNLSYNEHIFDNHTKSLEWSNLGIDICTKDFSMYCLANLLYRKAVSEYFLGFSGYQQSFKRAFFILELNGQYDLLEIFTSTATNKYKMPTD